MEGMRGVRELGKVVLFTTLLGGCVVPLKDKSDAIQGVDYAGDTFTPMGDANDESDEGVVNDERVVDPFDQCGLYLVSPHQPGVCEDQVATEIADEVVDLLCKAQVALGDPDANVLESGDVLDDNFDRRSEVITGGTDVIQCGLDSKAGISKCVVGDGVVVTEVLEDSQVRVQSRSTLAKLGVKDGQPYSVDQSDDVESGKLPPDSCKGPFKSFINGVFSRIDALVGLRPKN